jgi:hypothetical protein
MSTLADPLLSRALYGDAPRTVPDHACIAAIVFMAPTSTPWALLPVGEFGCGSVTTCVSAVYLLSGQRSETLGIASAPGIAHRR